MDLRVKDERGKRYGELVVLHPVSRRGTNGQVMWRCNCTCGRRTTVYGVHLRSGKTRSCGHAQGRRYTDQTESTYNAIINQYKREAKSRKLAWSLNRAHCLTLFNAPCAYCGIASSNAWRLRFKNAPLVYYNGIDRVDNLKGYVIDNVITACSTCNRAKRDMSVSAFLEWVRRVYRHAAERV